MRAVDDKAFGGRPAGAMPGGDELDRPDLSNGDPEVLFARLFDTYAEALHGYLAGRVGAHAADDLVAETFLLALRQRASYDPERAPVRAWLYGIATNLVRNHVRHEQRGYRATAREAARSARSAEAPDGFVPERVVAEQRVHRLAAALAKLRRGDRDVLLLTAWAGLEPTEVAEALGVPASTVRSRLHRVRRKLGEMLRRKEDEEHG